MEYSTETPIYLQVLRDLEKKIVQGRLEPGEKLPSSRELALLYKINQNTAARIYQELERKGSCFTRRGIGTFVTKDPETIRQLKETRARTLLTHFMEEMAGLGFGRDEILRLIGSYKEENDAGM